nr:hypothetical protein [Eubacterium sp.]
MNIAIYLNEADFEYDIHSLIRAFFPGEPVCVGESASQWGADLLLGVVYEEEDSEKFISLTIHDSGDNVPTSR